MLIHWSGLGEVFAIALLAGVGLVTLFSLGIASLGRRDNTEGGTATLSVTLAVICFVACAAIVGYGIYLVVAR
jgi:hypothetical protein